MSEEWQQWAAKFTPENCARHGHPKVRQLYGVPRCCCEYEKVRP